LGQLLRDFDRSIEFILHYLISISQLPLGQLIFFYTVFYIALGALFAICLKVLMMTINEQSPKWTLQESLIGTNPGLGFRPMSKNVDQGSLIWYNGGNQSQIKYWTESLDDFLSGELICNELSSFNIQLSLQNTVKALKPMGINRTATLLTCQAAERSANWTSITLANACMRTLTVTTTLRHAYSSS